MLCGNVVEVPNQLLPFEFFTPNLSGVSRASPSTPTTSNFYVFMSLLYGTKTVKHGNNSGKGNQKFSSISPHPPPTSFNISERRSHLPVLSTE